MDIKEEDKSEESRTNHITYYKSLTKVISEIQEEIKQEPNSSIKTHLENRIDAMEKDKKRIREMFPDISEEELNGNAR